jgi:hypothetical protein
MAEFPFEVITDRRAQVPIWGRTIMREPEYMLLVVGIFLSLLISISLKVNFVRPREQSLHITVFRILV